ncbi:hypothetical protein GW17_00052451 [Ensete ventricosum]|nr:hypothetical protein GW17_00052451 [Ensete ventricosum]RZR95626.1 hypothetical protein BHM03_00024503 [Ensete ventricosum]
MACVSGCAYLTYNPRVDVSGADTAPIKSMHQVVPPRARVGSTPDILCTATGDRTTGSHPSLPTRGEETAGNRGKPSVAALGAGDFSEMRQFSAPIKLQMR